MTDRYVFPVLGAEVIDGDTYRLTMDPGFRLTTVQPVRLDGWDTPEKHPVVKNRPGVASMQREVDAAIEAWRVAGEWFHTTAPIWCRTRKDPDSFGRWLGDIWIEYSNGWSNLGEHLQGEGLAVRWPQRWWQVYLVGDD